jgi:hypothetical protein
VVSAVSGLAELNHDSGLSPVSLPVGTLAIFNLVHISLVLQITALI